MGTRSRIGYELPDHSVVSVYCHWDGYPEFNGKMLVKYYNDRDGVKELIDGGSMSSLRTRSTWNCGPSLKDENGEFIRDAEGHIMCENDRDPQPQYHSERGEEIEVLHSSFDKFVSDNCGEEYAYLYDLNGNWKAFKLANWDNKIVERVEIPGYVTAAQVSTRGVAPPFTTLILISVHTTPMNFTIQELSALADLIAFHDDWDEVSERVGCDVALLHDKVMDMMTVAGEK